MNKNIRRVLAFMLAFVMVFAAAVPVMASDTSIGEQYVEPSKLIIEADTNGVKEGTNLYYQVFEGKAETQNWTFKIWGATQDGYDEIVLGKDLTLKPNTDYKIITSAELVESGTTYEYIFSTDASGKISKVTGMTATKGISLDVYDKDGNLKSFYFKAAVKGGIVVPSKYLQTLDASGESQGNVTLEIYNVKVNRNEDNKAVSFAFAGKSYIPDSKIAEITTDPYGYYSLEVLESEVAGYLNEVENDAANRKIVAIVRDGVVVAYADLENDDKVLVKAVPAKPNKLIVKVYGDTNETNIQGNPAPKAIEGAKVDLYKNITEIFKPETYEEKPFASATTNSEGKAVFEGVDAYEILRILTTGTDADLTTPGSDDARYTLIQLWNKAVVNAEGWITPKTMSLKEAKAVGNDLELTFTLRETNKVFSNRIGGEDRYETSVETAIETFGAEQQDTVILASGQNFADSLVASSLVGALNAPLVLTANNNLPKVTADYLSTVSPRRVVVVGNAISAKVHDQLEKQGIRISTLGGKDRYETAANVLEYVLRENNDVKKVLVTSGTNFADALVASVPAALNRQPIVLTDKDTFAPELNAILKEYKVEKATVVGGENSVSAKAYKEINVSEKERLFGENRQLTSMRVAEAYFSEGGKAIIVDGTDFPDAISAGQLAYVKNAPILLTKSKTTLGEVLVKFLQENKMTDITIVGGPNSVAPAIEKEIKDYIVK